MRSSATILFFLASIVNGQAKTSKSKYSKSTSKSTGPREPIVGGVIDLDFYTKHANAFVGLNPLSGDGSVFIFQASSSSSMTGETFGNVPDSGGGQNNICTCECKPSDSGIGCAGHAGTNYRYGSLLWVDPYSGKWTGQTQGLQTIPDFEFNFVGTDTRFSPGGPIAYNVACTLQDCGGLFAGVFRQYNEAVSCTAALAEEGSMEPSSCSVQCGDSGVYKEWLAYCGEDTDTSEETGFSGYGM